jgi:roadblock/LC7 domain-containing protein
MSANQITLSASGYDIASPTEVLALADVLTKVIKDKKLYTSIRGKAYVNVEGWQFAGGQLGIIPILEDVVDLSDREKGILKYSATVKLVNFKNQQTMGKGIAICSNEESMKRKFDEYAICSMAQTRAVGKAYRLLIGWLMKSAGYEATPLEEMDGVFSKPQPTVTKSTKEYAHEEADRMFEKDIHQQMANDAEDEFMATQPVNVQRAHSDKPF